MSNIEIEKIQIEKIQMALLLAFEAGKWEGQVELEEHYDKEQYATSIMEYVHSRKNAMPLYESSRGRMITINLRSNDWRDGVRKSADQYLKKAYSLIK